MNYERTEILATKAVVVLFEKNCTDAQMEHVKVLLNLFINEKKVPHEDIALAKVLENAVLLRSAKIMEKGFPLIYFIQSKKFLGFHEVISPSSKITEHLGGYNKEAALDGLKSFFRGCEFIDNVNLVEALREINISEKREEPKDNNALDVGLGSKLIENTMWSVKWGMDSAWNLVAGYAGLPQTDEKPLTIEDEAAKIDSMLNKDNFVDVAVLRLNWYGRTQKRIYRFHNDFFERVDPEGSKTGSEIVKAAYKYSDVSKITVENGADLVIHFRDPRLTTQWIHTPHDANTVISLICTRAPWTASIEVLRNLEMKMNSHNLHTVHCTMVSEVKSYPRWSKDGLYLAFEDERGWKSIDLERIDLLAEEWLGQDLVHFPDLYLKNTISSPRGRVINISVKVLTSEELENEFHSYQSTVITYSDARGLRTQHGGIIAEMVDSLGSNSTLFVTKATEFNGQWKLQHQKLRILDNKCGVPILSPDGKFVAFVEDHASKTIVVHRIDFLTHSNFLTYKANDVDLEEVLLDVRKVPNTSKVKRTPSKAPPLLVEQPASPDKPESSSNEAKKALSERKLELIPN